MNKTLIIFILLLLLSIVIIFYLIIYKEHFNNNSINKTYVINLDSRKDKLESIDKDLKKNNLEYERFSACDGKKLDIYSNDIAKYFDKNNKLTPGQIGCALSHIKIWEKAIENNYKYTLVLEDDAIIPENFNNKLVDIFNDIPENWHMILLGCFPYCNSKKIKGKKYINKIQGYGNDGTQAYLINISLIKKIMSNIIKLNHLNIPIDTWLQKFIYVNKNYNIYNSNELIIKQDRKRFKSDIWNPP